MFIPGQRNVVADALSRPVEQTTLQMNQENGEDEDIKQGEAVELNRNLNIDVKRRREGESDQDSVLDEEDHKEQLIELWDLRGDQLSEVHFIYIFTKYILFN